VIGQLQGLSVPAAAWEREVLPARLRGYKPEWLDELCQQGEIIWGRFHAARGEGEPRRGVTRAAPIGLALRSDAGWLLSQREPALSALSEGALLLKAQLEQRGALFFRELVQHTKKPAEELEPSLWELVAAGEVTSDGFAGLRALLDGAKETRANQPHPLHRGGRWSLLRPALEAEGGALTADQALEARVALLLRRHGVVFRDLVGREPHLPPWRELLRVFRRLEDRGDVRGGRFVAGFAGEQFALPGAVETLRAVRRIPRTVPEEVTVAAADPLNLTGLLTSARVAATSSQGVLVRDGVPVLAPLAEAG
jgi:ATP-dependent Lhr-like helicase